MALPAFFLGASLGIAGGWFIAQSRVDNCQESCARHGLVCSPRLRGGMDYCLRTGP